jgi:hypothetical protein
MKSFARTRSFVPPDDPASDEIFEAKLLPHCGLPQFDSDKNLSL